MFLVCLVGKNTRRAGVFSPVLVRGLFQMGDVQISEIDTLLATSSDITSVYHNYDLNIHQLSSIYQFQDLGAMFFFCF